MNIFLCGMLEPMKFGFFGGIWFLLLLFIQSHLGLDSLTIFRWLIAVFGLLIFTAMSYRNKFNQSFEFRLAWFSGFSVLIASQIIFGLFFLAIGEHIITADEPLELQEKSYIIMVEFGWTMMIGLIVLSILAALLKKQ